MERKKERKTNLKIFKDREIRIFKEGERKIQ